MEQLPRGPRTGFEHDPTACSEIRGRRSCLCPTVARSKVP